MQGVESQEENLKLLEEGGNVLDEGPTEQSKDRSTGSEDTDEIEEYKSTLNEDTFSFIIVSKTWSMPFLTGLMMFFLKTSIYTLVLLNVIQWNASFNKLGIPVNISSSVVISQFIAFGITVFTQDDLITVMVVLYEGFNDVQRAVPHVCFKQWICAVALALLDALLGLFATFVLIVNSGTVLEVLLNFAAVEFVSQLDNTAFGLAEKGFLGTNNQEEAREIKGTEYTVRGKARVRRRIRFVGMSLVLLVVGVSWLVVYINQIQGRYAVGSIHVQFDDSTNPALATYNGFYNVNTNVRILPGATRFLYDEERSSGKGQFAFCRSSTRWVFLTARGSDPCIKGSNVLAQATKIRTFQLSDTGSLPWFATRPRTFDRIEMPAYQLAEACSRDVDCGPHPMSVCVRNRCRCQNEWTGSQCDYRKNESCAVVEVDSLRPQDFSAQRSLPTFFALQNYTGEAYNRSVYFNEATGDLMLFTGLRWVITRDVDIKFEKSAYNNVSEFVGSDAFHSSMIMAVDLMSEPVWFSTTSDKFMDPRELQWYKVLGRPKLVDANPETKPENALLICAICNDETNPCLYNNVCNANGQCECANGETGSLCQNTPVGDGKCDPFFNDVAFQYDGGDCCPSTCNDATYECGSMLGKKGGAVRVGFPYCKDPTVLSAGSTDPTKFQFPASPIKPLSSKDVSPILSANGMILIVAEPDFDTVRVFDRQTNKWFERSVPLEGVLRTRFGDSVDIATVPGTIRRRTLGRLSMVLAVSSGGEFPSVHVFEWRQGDITWNELPRIDLKNHTLCLDGCNVTVGAGATPQVDRTTDYFIAVNVAEEGRTSNTLFKATSSGVSSAIQWQNTTLVASDLVSVTSNGRFIMLFDASGTNGTVFDVKAKSEIPGELILPEQYKSQPNIEVLAVQISANGDNFGCIFKLSNDSTTTAFIQHYKVNLQRQVPFSLDSELEIIYPFDVAEFSTEGDASAAILTGRNVSSGTDTFRVLQLDRVNAKFESLGQVSTTDINLQQEGPTHASISSDAFTLAFGGMKSTEVIARRHLCASDEATFRFTFRTDSNPDEVSWNVSTVNSLYGSVVTNDTVRRCSNCYSDASFARSEVEEVYCIPLDAVPCLRFNFESPTLEPNSFYSAILIEANGVNTTVEPFAIGRGKNASQSVVLNSSSLMCEEQPPSGGCSDTEEEFLVRFLFDSFPQDIEWQLRSGAGFEIRGGGNYDPSLAATSFRDGPHCVPTNTCFNFTVLDKFGDGLCCEGGYGEYVGFLGRNEVFRGGVFNSSESNLFGAC